MKKKTGWLVLRIETEFQTSMGWTVNLEVGDHIGSCSVYKTKEAAQKVYGKDATLLRIQYAKDN